MATGTNSLYYLYNMPYSWCSLIWKKILDLNALLNYFGKNVLELISYGTNKISTGLIKFQAAGRALSAYRKLLVEIDLNYTEVQ